MDNLPTIKKEIAAGKKIILRADLDVDPEESDFRLKSLLPTLRLLSESKALTTIIGHKGRPNGQENLSMSLEPVCAKLSELLGEKIIFNQQFSECSFSMMENLRFEKGEEENSEELISKICSYGDIYVNEAFSVSHRKHASIVGVPQKLNHYAGLRFQEEVRNLSKLVENPDRPFVVVLGGFKNDKLDYLEGLKEISDKILVGGRLPDYMGDLGSVRSVPFSEKVVPGNLIMDKEDISIHTIERFEEEIGKAKTILLAGPMGKFEEEGHRQGTSRVVNAIIDSNAFKIAGGGDTIQAIETFKLEERFDYLSVAGGAMLEFLVKKTLPGIEALIN